jgi:type VI secretion system protein ImpK
MNPINTSVAQTAQLSGLFFPYTHPLATVAENYLQPKAALTHLPLANPNHAYYRSKILPVNQGVNPLLACAAALLALLTQLRAGTTSMDHELYALLIHEIKAFEFSAQQNGYRTEHVLVARYLLCATLDEAVVNVTTNYQLLPYFHGEAQGDERFFLILERLSIAPATHIDLLELIYVCLNLGFTGKYQQRPQGRAELDIVMERLYQSIRQQRGEIKKFLSVGEQIIKQTKPVITAQPLPTWLLTSFAALLFVVLYLGFNFMLESSVAPLYQEFNNVIQTYADD